MHTSSTPVCLISFILKQRLLFYNQVRQVVPGTVKRLVRHVGTNGEVHKTTILTTYYRHSHRDRDNQEDFEDLDDEYLGLLFLYIPCLLVYPLAFY